MILKAILISWPWNLILIVDDLTWGWFEWFFYEIQTSFDFQTFFSLLSNHVNNCLIEKWCLTAVTNCLGHVFFSPSLFTKSSQKLSKKPKVDFSGMVSLDAGQIVCIIWKNVAWSMFFSSIFDGKTFVAIHFTFLNKRIFCGAMWAAAASAAVPCDENGVFYSLAK